MKSAHYLGVVIPLLTLTAALHTHNIHEHGGQVVIQDGVPSDNADILENTTDHIEDSTPKPTYPPTEETLDPILVDIDELDESGDAGPFAHHSPIPKFTIGTKTSQWAIAYVPYTDDLNCKPPSAIHLDVATIAQKGFTTIRLYATDCSALKHVGSAARSHNLKLILGIHIDSPAVSPVESQIDEIIAWAAAAEQGGSWEMVELVTIGNEAIFNEFCLPATLASFITSARSALRAAGYPGPLTTTEPLPTLLSHATTLCPVIDIAAANIHPFFHAEVSADQAGGYVADQLAQLEMVCEGLQGVNLETGWPRRGSANGEAVPGWGEQMVAVEGILRREGGRCVVLGFGDDGWKDGGEFGVEGSWGCGHLFGGGR